MSGSADQAGEKLLKWMNDPPNYHARESILMHRLCFDIQLSAARRGYYINTYYDDVDHDGFDIIFDDQDTIKKIQVKSVDVKNTTQTWAIHKKLLRPAFGLIEELGFEPSPAGEGTGGGVVVMRFDSSKPDLSPEYLYTDVFVLSAFEHQVIKRRDGRRQTAVDNYIKSLRTEDDETKVNVPEAAFLTARGGAGLLALAGLHSELSSSWEHLVTLIAQQSSTYIHQPKPLPGPVDQVKQTIRESLGRLVIDQDLNLSM